MNKFICATALVGAMITQVGAVESQIVGYKDNVTPQNVARFSVLTFAKVGDQSRKLGDLTPISMSGSGKFGAANFTITFYDSNGAQRLVKDDTQIATMYPAAATDPAVKDAPVQFAWKSGVGWMLAAEYSSTPAYPMDEYAINDCDGFQIYVGNTAAFSQGVKLICSGCVPDARTPIVTPQNTAAFSGNTTLKACTLGSLTPVSMSGSGKFGAANFTITFYDPNGAQRLVKDDTQIATMYPAAITDPTVMDAPVQFAWKSGVGWMLAAEYSSTPAYPMNDYVINPEDGFQTYVGNTAAFSQGVKIELPNALE